MQKISIKFDNKKVLIVIGEHRPFTENEFIALEHFCKNCNCAIYTNHLSNYNGEYSFDGNLLLHFTKAIGIMYIIVFHYGNSA